MKKRLVIFGIWALICLVALPAWAILSAGSPSGSVPANEHEGLELFQINCGACHTLKAAGTDGIVGPDLDLSLGVGEKSPSTVEDNRKLVLNAIKVGREGRMPKGILKGEQAKAVAQFVAENLDYIGP